MFGKVKLLAVVSIMVSWFLLGAAFGEVLLSDKGQTVALSNGLIEAEFAKAGARLVSLSQGDGVELLSPSGGMMHMDTNYRLPSEPSRTILKGPKTSYRVIREEKDLVEISFLWDDYEDYPFQVDMRVVMRSEQSGYYFYMIFKRDQQAPAVWLEQLRLCGFFNPDVFTRQAINLDRRGQMPTPDELNNGTELNPREAVKLQNGQVYCKYDWVEFTKDTLCHGIYGTDKGVWIVAPSHEWATGWPTKQDLTTHQTSKPMNAPALLMHCQTRHFIDPNEAFQRFDAGEAWEKFYGPFFIYVNSGKPDLVADAMEVADRERAAWPYAWLTHPAAGLERGTVSGILKMEHGTGAAGACVILAQPTDSAFQWQHQGKGYIYCVDADSDGRFVLRNVRPGNYTLYSFVAGVFGTFRKDGVEVAAQLDTDLGALARQPVAYGKILWQIGVPDRSAAKFKNGDLPRGWVKSHSYEKDFPHDVDFVVGQSKESEDWHYYQPPAKKLEDGSIVPSTWSIRFNLDPADIPAEGECRMTVALAGANYATLRLRMNGKEIKRISPPNDFLYQFGQSQGLYSLHEIFFASGLLQSGSNTLLLDQEGSSHSAHVMYDCLRLEIRE
jgi:rhamnogalacturonan endolyase